MKTISGHSVSTKEISLSKAAKILSKFVSADNGASHVINAYLHRASSSFNELNQLHKELKSPHSHKKHKRHKIETDDDSGRVVEKSVRSVETNQELSNGRVKSKNEFGRRRCGSENADEDDEKSTQTVVKSSRELNGSIVHLEGNVGGTEKHKKNKKKKQEVESGLDGDSRLEFGEREGNGKLPTGEQNETKSGQEQGNGGDNNPAMEEGKKQKREKKKKHREGTEEVKMEQRKKRKKEDMEGRPEDRSGDLTKKRMKRKHEGNP